MSCRILLVALICVAAANGDDLGLKVAPGFKVTLWADHTLANDIYTMALDQKGRVVVSGPGYIRRLEDTKGLGKADKATDIAPTKTGAMGLMFGGYTSPFPHLDDLYSAGDGQIRVFEHTTKDSDFYEKHHTSKLSFAFTEHGGHSLKLGPDGEMYAIAGNDSRLDQAELATWSSIKNPLAGGILNFRDRQLNRFGVIADGFRNPYDFDFTPLGDMITFDSDTERDHLLPWYTPTRVYHVLPGASHGWRQTGYLRSLAKRDEYSDTVGMLADMGRGSPTGVCCYRHTQFPTHYRGGVFLLDWTFGKVHYLPLIPEGSSYKKVPAELFLEATGTNGFAPTSARVGLDGSLFISIGGRGTRGAVYKVEYVGDKITPPPPKKPLTDLEIILDAPQPLEAWSIAQWGPLLTFTVDDIIQVAWDEGQSDAHRVRAIEILVHRFALNPVLKGNEILQSHSPVVRARFAWALGCTRQEEGKELLISLARDADPRVRVAALSSMIGLHENGENLNVSVIAENLGHEDRRVRLLASRLVSKLEPKTQIVLEKNLLREGTSRALVAFIVGATWEGSPVERRADNLLSAVKALELAANSTERADAVRSIQLCAGDWKTQNPLVELYSAYSLNWLVRPENSAYMRLVLPGFISKTLAAFPSKNDHENMEASRLLAMLEVDHAEAIPKVLGMITADSHPTQDFHYLIVLSRLKGARTAKHVQQIGDALLDLERKLDGRNLRVKQTWNARFGELAIELLKSNPGLEKLLGEHKDLVRPGHVVVAAVFKGEARILAARRFLDVVKLDAEFPMSAELIDLLAILPPTDFTPVFRGHWADRSARDAMVKLLARQPDPADRTLFLEVVESGSAEAARLCLTALALLKRDDDAKNLVPLLSRLRQAFAEPKEAELRKDLIAAINRQSGQSFRFNEVKTDSSVLAVAYQPLYDWFAKTHPAEAKSMTTSGEDEEAVRKIMATVNWEAGNAERGSKVFRDRSCLACHGGSTRLGPDLKGVGGRLSRDDLFTSIINPSRDVAPAYRVTNVDLKDGKRLSGLIVFESADGLIVQAGAAETRRVATADIESRTPSAKSLMPDNLLKGLRPEDLADLYAFIRKQ